MLKNIIALGALAVAMFAFTDTSLNSSIHPKNNGISAFTGGGNGS